MLATVAYMIARFGEVQIVRLSNPEDKAAIATPPPRRPSTRSLHPCAV